MSPLAIFALAAVGTIAIKGSSILFFKNPQAWPPWLQAALRLVAPAALGAIVANSLLLDEGAWRSWGAWHLAALVAVVVAVVRRSAGWTMLAGAAAFVAALAAGL